MDEAENGLYALELIDKNQYDLILMDINMPGMNGFETTIKIRQNKITTPIIALTAFSKHEIEQEAIDSGEKIVIMSDFQEIAEAIRGCKAEHYVLGLATGSSPIGVYKELVRLHKEEGLSFKNVVSFNLDEYFGLKAEDKQSYHSFMYTHLFDHIDIPKDQIHIPKGDIKEEDVNFKRNFSISYYQFI